jgi:hypothetical protein
VSRVAQFRGSPPGSKPDDKKTVRYLDAGARILDKDGNRQDGVLSDALHRPRKGHEIGAEAMGPLRTERMGK